MKTIVMLMPHFGQWPEWINIYMETCRYNPTVDWIFFTDCGRTENHPGNVRFLDMSYRDFLHLASRKLEVDLPESSLRKLCDFRPMYGVIFEEYLQGYDYFGFGDVDVVYGEIRKFVSDRLLEDHDILSFHSGMISGHFALLRCSEPVKQLFRKMEEWASRLQDPRHLRMDEDAFSEIVHLVRTSEVEMFSTPSLFRKWKDGTWNFPTQWYWHEGRITNDRDDAEYLYFHFLYWKGDANPWGWRDRLPPGQVVHGDWRHAPAGWRIDADGFRPLDRWPVEISAGKRWWRSVWSRLRFERAWLRLKAEGILKCIRRSGLWFQAGRRTD